MSDATPVRRHEWLIDRLPRDVADALAVIERTDDVAHIAVMPDVHLAGDFCVGTAVATRGSIIPAAVGGDIGCGIAAVAFDAEGELLRNERHADDLLSHLAGAVPSMRHRRAVAAGLPTELADWPLSAPQLEAVKNREARLQLGTLGSGNHFLEFQADDAGRLWLMVHSGSRGVGQAISHHHAALTDATNTRVRVFPANDPRAAAYLGDAAWAERYASASRRAMIDAAAGVMRRLFGVTIDAATSVDCNHNHVRTESHHGEKLWVHSKGASSAAAGEPGLIPGSMGTASFHVEGCGHADALASSSHGAGRTMSRDAARRSISPRELSRQMRGVRFDAVKSRALYEEAPDAYKDIRLVMRAQRDLVRVVRRLVPIVSFKG